MATKTQRQARWRANLRERGQLPVYFYADADLVRDARNEAKSRGLTRQQFLSRTFHAIMNNLSLLNTRPPRPYGETAFPGRSDPRPQANSSSGARFIKPLVRS